MSFATTPLGQSRRLDPEVFFRKPIPKDVVTPRDIRPSIPYNPSSVPDRPSSPIRDNSALQRFAKQKQREAELRNLNPTPSQWPYKDTSVNIANAFTSAAASSEPMRDPNAAWASGSRATTVVPRSTSVEFEEQARQNAAKRLPGPSRPLGRGASTSNVPSHKQAPPPSRTRSVPHLPDSEGDESGYGGILNAARRALGPALETSFYVRERNAPGNDSTYDYGSEEASYQDAAKKTAPKRGRISVDNQAYKPAQSEGESSSEDDSDGGRRKRKVQPTSRLTGLPTVADGKTTKKRRTKAKGNLGDSFEDISEDISNADILPPNFEDSHATGRTSVDPPNLTNGTFSHVGANLHSISEDAEDAVSVSAQQSQLPVDPPPKVRTRARSRSNSRSRGSTPARTQRFSIGGALGSLVKVVFAVLKLIVAGVFYWIGGGVGKIFDTMFYRPYRWASHAHVGPGVKSSIRYTIAAVIVAATSYFIAQSGISLPALPSWSPSRPEYIPPIKPPQDFSEVVRRMTAIESSILGVTYENDKIKARADAFVRSFAELESKIGHFEGKLSAESRRISETEQKAREAIQKTIGGLVGEIESLHAQIKVQQKIYEKEKSKPIAGSDEDARAKLRALEARLAVAEDGMQEALDLGKKLASAPAHAPVPVSGDAWWNKVVADSKGKLKLTAPDGTDVVGLISTLVDNSVANAMNDRNSKADYALHSGGARVIPTLTSPTFEIKPDTVKAQVLGILTGNGHAIGRPPVTALHHELHNGHCWPFGGTQGQLGVALASPVYVDEITIDHVAKDIAFDMRSAPRQMEVWGLVEGEDNKDKLREYRAEQLMVRKVQAEAAGEVVDAAWEKQELAREKAAYPPGLPKTPEYVRIANFTYDIHAPSTKNIQTFPVDPEIQKLNVDFGLVVLRVLNNWGRDEYTCLYRFRVHGRRFGEVPPTWSEA